jgi:hypothetical protein
MSRKDRDEFRQGLDNLMRDIIIPAPYHRLESPIFNPVLHHPNAHLSEFEEHFVVRIDIRQNLEDTETYRVRNVEYTRIKGETLEVPK